MKKFLVLSLACLVGVASHAGRAAVTSGKELYDSCQAKNAKSAAGDECLAYIHGFVDGMIMGYTAHGTTRGYCPPVSGVSAAQGLAIIEKWLHDHPERLGTDAGISAGLALSEAYPCKADKN
jgi:hypothetical protein